MKKAVGLLIVMCILCNACAFAAEIGTERGKVYVFGDDWACEWAKVLDGFFAREGVLINAAGHGELLSGTEKKPEYAQIESGDVVVLSYGIMEKDRPGDKNADFKKTLENVTDSLTKKGAKVMFVSIASTMRYNTMTGKMEETKNFYTETARAFAKSKGITYIDLAALTAEWANKTGSVNAARLYKSPLELTETGNKICAYEVFKKLCDEKFASGTLRANLSCVYEVKEGETGKIFDVFFEETVADCFAVYVKGGQNVRVNMSEEVSGDATVYCKSENGKIDVRFSRCEKIQIAPCYCFDAGGRKTGDEPFAGDVPPGVYDITVKKTEPLKASVYVNGYLTASNLDMPGTQSVTEAAEHTFGKFELENGHFEVTVVGLTDKLEYVKMAESATIYKEKPRIFVGGDSTLCNYYPLKRTGEEADGTVMTGWAMLLDRYVDAEVVNLAASGDWAAKWKKSSFGIIEKEGKAGDIFVVQFGINDRYNSTIEEMSAALNEMIDACAEKDMIPILVSPQISAGYGWGDAANAGKSDGGEYEKFFDAVRRLAEEKNCFYVDLTDLSAGWFSEIGRENVYKKYHLWDSETNTPADTMHLSYKGADAMCRFFVLAVERIATEGKCDAWGNTLSALKIW